MRHGAVRRKREQALTPQFPCVHGKSLGGALGTTGRVEPYIYIYLWPGAWENLAWRAMTFANPCFTGFRGCRPGHTCAQNDGLRLKSASSRGPAKHLHFCSPHSIVGFLFFSLRFQTSSSSSSSRHITHSTSHTQHHTPEITQSLTV